MPITSFAFRVSSSSRGPLFEDAPRLHLTRRQLEILQWVEAGKSASDIGGILGISGRTVEGHILKLRDRMGVRTRLQAVLLARDLGLLRDERPGLRALAHQLGRRASERAVQTG